MEKQQEIRALLQECLNDSEHPHLADCLDLIPEDNQHALYDFINHQASKRVNTTIIAFQVAEDVSAIVAGFTDGAEFSKPFLNARAA